MIKYCTIIVGISLLLTSCKTAQTPYFPLHMYKTIIHGPTPGREDVFRANQGAYRLDVVVTDTVFARKHLEYYSIGQVGDRRKKVVDSVLLYFIDDYRFVYTKKALQQLDLKNLPDGETKIGLYDITKNTATQDVFVTLYMASSKVKHTTDFEYGRITLQLSDDGRKLLFRAADYPLHLKEPEDPVNDSQPAFSPIVLEQATNRLYRLPHRNFESENLGLVATYYFVDQPVSMMVDGVTFDHISYPQSPLNAERQLRRYLKAGQEVMVEEIHEERQKTKLKSW